LQLRRELRRPLHLAAATRAHSGEACACIGSLSAVQCGVVGVMGNHRLPSHLRSEKSGSKLVI
jgi:hypothetical protein